MSVSWAYNEDHRHILHIIKAQPLWDKTTCRLSLPQVRNDCLKLLVQKKKAFQERIDQEAHAYHEMIPLLIIYMEGAP